jgi:hypothetical protein
VSGAITVDTGAAAARVPAVNGSAAAVEAGAGVAGLSCDAVFCPTGVALVAEGGVAIPIPDAGACGDACESIGEPEDKEVSWEAMLGSEAFASALTRSDFAPIKPVELAATAGGAVDAVGAATAGSADWGCGGTFW